LRARWRGQLSLKYSGASRLSDWHCGKTEIVPLLIVTKLEQFQYREATALAVVMLAGSLLTLLAANVLQSWNRKWAGHDF
jgi:ABC-type sulfate transport system permease component